MDQEIKKEFEVLTDVMRRGFDSVENRLDGVENRLTSLEQKVEDGFNHFEAKFAQFGADLQEVKDSLKRLEKRTKEDADVSAEEIISLRHRVEILEKQFKNLQSSAA